METLSEKKTERVRSSLLSEVNSLSQAGKYQAAIEILEEQLARTENDPGLLRSLGQLYLNTHSPQKAAEVFQRARSIQLSVRLAGQSSEPSRNEDKQPTTALGNICLDELDFIEQTAFAFQPLRESYASEQEGAETGVMSESKASDSKEIDTVKLVQQRSTLSLNRASGSTSGNIRETKPHPGPNIIYSRGKKMDSSGKKTAPLSAQNGAAEQVVIDAPVAETSSSDTSRQTISSGEADNLITEKTGCSVDQATDRTVLPIQKSKRVLSSASEENEDFEDEESEDFLTESEDWIYLDEGNEDSNFDDDGASDEFASETEMLSEDVDSKDFYDTDEYEYLIDIDELIPTPQDDVFEFINNNQTLTREQRARQKAVDFLRFADWPNSALPLVQMVFLLNGWGPARVALEREAQKGLKPEELILAAHLKAIWAENDYLWTSFERTGSTRLSHRVLSWPMALHIVRSFELLPQEEELMILVEAEYEYWMQHPQINRAFRSFALYLWFRFSGVKGVLPPEQHFSFEFPDDLNDENYGDLGFTDVMNYEKKRVLEGYGLVLDDCRRSPRPIKTEFEEVWEEGAEQ